MEENKIYSLPNLDYKYKELEPYISEEQLRLHHQKHHKGYVNKANAILEKIEKARKENLDLDTKSVLKDFSFNAGGHFLHSLFWSNLAPAGKGGGGKPGRMAAYMIENQMGGFERFKREFSQTALSVEGSGWVALGFCKETGRPMIMQIEKHNVNIYPTFEILMVLDVWEHAYYLDYKNERSRFIEAFWNIVNWEAVNNRLEGLL